MKHRRIVLLILFLVFVLACVAWKVRENFILTTSATELAVQQEQRKCIPIYKALGENDSDIPISSEFRIQSSSKQGQNTCYIRASDAVLADNSNCSKNNPNLYSDAYSSAVHSIYPGTETDPNLSTIAGTPVCYINFNSNANPSVLADYASYINSQDPYIRNLNKEVASLSNLYKHTNNNLTNVSSQLVNTSTALNLSSACNTQMAGMVNTYSTANTSLSNNVVTLANQLANANTSSVFNPNESMIKKYSPANPGLNMCIDVKGASTADFGPTILYQCWGGANQKWTMDDKMRLVNKNSGKCLDIYHGGDPVIKDGTALIQHSCHDGPNMKWMYDNKRRLRSVKDLSKCVDVLGVNNNNPKFVDGMNMAMFPCGEGPSQKWSL
jgi:Ricin-type beta-trefoil lectin domain